MALTACLVLASCGSAIASPPPPAVEPGPTTKPPERIGLSPGSAKLTTPIWSAPEPPLELHWELLRLPERVFRLALSPLYPLVAAFERYRLDQRLYDLVTNDARTILVVPLLFVVGSDGFGSGLLFRHSDVWGDDEALGLSASIYTNVDYALQGSYEQVVAFLNGRTLRLDVGYEEDENVRYFGIGGDTGPGDERAIGHETFAASLSADALAPVIPYLQSKVTLSFWRQRLSPGTRPGVPRLGTVPGDDDLLPPGFGRAHNYLEGRLSLGLDRREPPGRTTSGWTMNLDFTLLHDLDPEGELSSARLDLAATVFALVLPRYRVLVLSAGGGAAFPWGDDEEIPLGGYVSLGRSTHLRGFARDRFFDRYSWWASAEYRYPIVDYPIHEHISDELTVSFTLFADVARAGDSADELFTEAPRWSSGFGLQFATATYAILLFQLGFSPEGAEVIFSLGSLPI